MKHGSLSKLILGNLSHMAHKLSRFAILFILAIGLVAPANSTALHFHQGIYDVSAPFDLALTPPPDAHFEIPFWIVPGGMRQVTISTSYSYKCYTPLNPLTDAIRFESGQCVLATRDLIHKGNTDAQEWGRNYHGIFTQHWITVSGADRLVAIGGGENKNENIGGNCGQGGRCYQNTINTNVLCGNCASGYCNNGYTDCWDSYNAFINLSWQYFDASHEWGMLPHLDTGPILWPSNGYTYNGRKSSEGIRHPHGFVDQSYIWVFYEDKSWGDGNRGYGIKLARSPVSSGGLPGSWKSYCNGSWESSLPPGFSSTEIGSFYSRQGGCASPVLPTGGFQDSFAVAKDETGNYWGIEEHHTSEKWELRLWRSNNLVNWNLEQSLLSAIGDWDKGELHYPVFVSKDGWHNDLIQENDFYIVGTRNGVVRAIRVQRAIPFAHVYLPLIMR